MNNINNKKLTCWAFGALFLIIFISAFFDLGLAAGLCLVVFLTAITLLLFILTKVEGKTLYVLFIASLIIHMAAALFMHYSHFQPFSGGIGDYTTYDQEARTLAQNFRNGNFSLIGVSLTTYFSVLIGSIYALFLPRMIVGVLFAAFLGSLTAVFSFLIAKELGGSNKLSFLVALASNIYPSYIFYGSLLLRDTVIIPLTIIGLFLVLKIAKKFSWWNFIVLYAIMAAEVHLRIYVGYSLLVTFFLSFLLIGNLKINKKIIYCIIIIPVLGFLPQISGYGYYGANFLKDYLNPKTIALYQNIYNPASPQSLSPNTVVIKPDTTETAGSNSSGSEIGKTNPVIFPETMPAKSIGLDSSFVVNINHSNPITLGLSYAKYFCYILLGPLPWQIKQLRQYFALAETIPWYFLLFFVIKGIIMAVRTRNKKVFPLVFFSLLVLGALTVFVSNFGIITRIRIPAFISLSCLAPLAFIKIRGRDNKN